MPYTQYHPVYLDLKGREILIVGGGAVAIEKLESLMPSGGHITIVSPEVRSEIRAWAKEGRLTWKQREFRADDVEPAYMVIAATDDPELNGWVYRCGNSKHRLTNSVDDPVNCNFIMSAIAKRGPMQVAVSSAGCSPALAQRVRNRILSEILTHDVGCLAEFVGDRRAEVKSRLPGYKVRQAFWERLIDSEVLDLLVDEKHDSAEELFQKMLSAAVDSAPGDFSKKTGRVFLVGAGPGDPELITLKAVRTLQKADVVLYDRLVNRKLLDHAPSRAEKIYVGKEVGHTGKGRQRWICEQMAEYARQGKNVVRLKGGDPFVFGRGGEEMLFLHAAEISFEVIPGISSALAGPAAAGIPVTHRGVSTSFSVFAGHEAEGQSDVPWDIAAKAPTAIFLMGVERLPGIVDRLLEYGRSPSTPVAIVSNATLANQVVVSGTLADIVQKSWEVSSPATIVVGDVVQVREAIRSSSLSLELAAWQAERLR